MSLKPSHLRAHPWLYAVGNTPAVCLTQSHPPDDDLAILLLGCGDIRNVLFTAYAGMGIGDRKLDLTCCDIEAEIIARNIIAITLILDDTNGAHVQQIWDIYYHPILDKKTLSSLKVQATKLVNHAHSIQDWQNGPYGSLMRFCDSITFARVVKLWELYAIDPSDTKQYKAQQDLLQEQWKHAQNLRKNAVGEGSLLDGVRAYAPILTGPTLDVSTHQRTFWKNGKTTDDRKSKQKDLVFNPLFVCLRNGLVLHYGIDPLAGFHLATVYAKLAAHSTPHQPHLNSSTQAAKVALDQFSAWSAAFRKRFNHFTLRFVNSDAVAFCHVLQYHRTHGTSDKANWYRTNWEYNCLVLDSDNYVDDGDAPTSFDIIDTSNLIDHLGSLNLLSAATPLLLPKPSSVMRTEVLIPRDGSVAESSKSLLCGDLPTLAVLFGLKPLEYWTDSTATWHVKDTFMRSISKDSDFAVPLSRHIILWKLIDISMVCYEACDMANLVFKCYLVMFQDESWTRSFEILSLDRQQAARKLKQSKVYTRGSLSVVLHAIKKSGVVAWESFIDTFIEKVLNDQTLNMGAHHIQALFVHLHMLGLSKLEKYTWWHPQSFHGVLAKGPFRYWTNIPSVVCVTMLVPYKAVEMFADMIHGNGTPICYIMLQSSLAPNQSFFSDIQLGFGKVAAHGVPFTDGYAIRVKEDDKGWDGKSALVVSAMVSTCFLVEHGDPKCGVHFALHSTPLTVGQFGSKLGVTLDLHKSAIGQSDVFVTKFRPNISGQVSIGSSTLLNQTSDANPSIRPSLDAAGEKFSGITVHYDIVDENVKTLLQSGGQVAFETSNPFCLRLRVGSGKFREEIRLPLPLNGSHGKTKIARKSCWVEYSAPLAELELLMRRADMVFPCNISSHGAILENLHYVASDVLPLLATGQANSEWLHSTTSPFASMSPAELADRERLMGTSTLSESGRVGFKDSMFSIIMHSMGLQNMAQCTSFALQDPSGSDVSIVLLGAGLRMDLSNQTVFLDAAAIALNNDIIGTCLPPIVAQIERRDMVGIKMNDAEFIIWKHVLPGFAERCREWKHDTTCQYMLHRSIPLSIEKGERMMCSCGLGVFPEGYLKGLKEWNILRKFAVRVAIPVCYTSPVGQNQGTEPVVSQSVLQARASGHRQNSPFQGHILDLDSKLGACFECGAHEAKGGGVLAKCARCKFAQYCSAECQKENWAKEHKAMCKQLKELNDAS